MHWEIRIWDLLTGIFDKPFVSDDFALGQGFRLAFVEVVTPSRLVAVPPHRPTRQSGWREQLQHFNQGIVGQQTY